MKPASAKQKGRRLQQEVASALRNRTGLRDSDIKSVPMGTQGEDIWMSQAAREKLPFAIECKNVERINIWKAWAQAKSHSNATGLKPMLVLGKNREETVVVLRFYDFLEIVK